MQNIYQTIFINITLIALTVFLAIASRHSLHMLQLNSYFGTRYLKWYAKNIKRELPILTIIPVIFSFSFFALFLAVIILFGLSLILAPKPQEKKKFVVTARVKRIYVTMAVLIAIIFMVVNVLNILYLNVALKIVMAVVTLLFGFIMPIPVIANAINIPIEAIINNWYVNDAKKILNQNKGLIKIGITGSFGKTSTKFILSRILAEKYNVLMTPESYNTLMGVVKTIRLMMKNTDEVFVCEMGANQTRDIKDLCNLVNPTYGVLTSIGMQHLETFKTPENIVKTKYDLVNALPENGLAFLNFENDIIKDKKSDKPYVSYGVENPELDYWASDIKYDANGVEFVLNSKSGLCVNLKSSLLGLHNVINIVSACA
ncbi:MAG: UDP-N-acetylmuramoyl-tripeptide--D-alanyl-D-alanine ligase, partial [Oscillospiraceae bacterium]|nr:UDP-N-acetylmuramoyl-tripeptide--D-alanyl-D-alanine ligase [Oscillospiraceae bacterium]